MEKYKVITICAASVLTVGLVMVLHEAAHVLAGSMAGGTPTLMTSTEVLGDFDSLSPAGFAALGVAGFVVNILFCALGWWMLNRKPATAELQLTAWLFFVVNGMIVAMGTLSESLAGYGDWMTILGHLPGTTFLRGLFTILGAIGLIFMVRRSGATLARLIPPGESKQRTAEARRIVLIGAIATSILVLGSSIANPIGTTRGILLALGAGLGPFIGAIFGTRFVSQIPSENTEPLTYGGWSLYLTAGLTTLIMWFIVGPGITLN